MKISTAINSAEQQMNIYCSDTFGNLGQGFAVVSGITTVTHNMIHHKECKIVSVLLIEDTFYHLVRQLFSESKRYGNTVYLVTADRRSTPRLLVWHVPTVDVIQAIAKGTILGLVKDTLNKKPFKCEEYSYSIYKDTIYNI